MIGAAGAWLIAALVLGIAELAAPGIFLVFLAIAAAVTGVALLALPELPIAVQLASFAVWSTATVLIGRRWYRDYPVAGADPMLNDRSARMVGQIVIVETAIVDGRGRVLVGDGSWPARGDDAAAGTRVRITRVADGVADVTPV
ncbi:NfeD family protein [Sphingomonas sp. Leaf20]|uniref:NfeD family protein n=1 Tax=Sphingomonas sp. Leaf20 TaxID=1735685 RepID=UPI001F26BA10|nr:NfeD family protein [Sphingomonas sp. Leaf20]